MKPSIFVLFISGPSNGVKAIKSLNNSILRLSIGIEVGDKTVIVPLQVKDRHEWNSNIYLLHKRKKRKKYKPINTYLRIPFPVHNTKFFVGEHNKGYKNRGNIDLFKHYYRMYKKNKWIL